MFIFVARFSSVITIFWSQGGGEKMCLFIVQNKKEKCYVPKAIYLVSNAGVKPVRLFLELMIQQKYLRYITIWVNYLYV